MQYDEEELSIEGIKAACKKHFSPSLERKGLSCDVLAGEQGPSCHSVKHIPDLKVIHVRFIKSSSTPDSRPIANDYESSSSRQQCCSEPVTPPRRNQQDPKCFSQAALILSMESSSSSYCTNSQGPTLVYFWALPDTSELSLCTTNSCLSRMLPFLFFFAPPSPVLCLFAFVSFLNVPQDFFLLSAMLTCHKVKPTRHLGLWQF